MRRSSQTRRRQRRHPVVLPSYLLPPPMTKALFDPSLPPTVRQRHPLALAWRQLDNALDDFFAKELLAA